jgi:acyl-CoA dehydrogenase
METIARYGTGAPGALAQALLEGEIRSAFAMTEPEVASSDATNICTRIERQGDEYVINGHKWWISGAGDPAAPSSSPWARPTPRRPSTRSRA